MTSPAVRGEDGADGRPFSEQVTDPAWHREVGAWLASVLAQAGLAAAGPVEQPRVRAWSTQLVVPVVGGRVWFKANCAAQSFEPRLQAFVGRLLPHHVDQPVGVEPERGWMVTRDRGTTLRASHQPTPADWQAVLRQSAEVQRGLVPHASAMVRLGLPDCSPATVPARLEEMATVLAGLSGAHPAHLSSDLAAQIRAAAPRVTGAAETLAASPLRPSLQHGDLHPGNVFAVDGELHVFDFGDAQLAHPLESLSVPWAITHAEPDLPWQELLAAYHEPWADLVTRAELAELMAAAIQTQAVNRSFTWWSCLSQASDQEWTEWGEAPVRHLANVLLPWP